MTASARSAAKLLFLIVALGTTHGTLTAAPTASYPQPQPSGREQYMLELINAARANPPAEGQMLTQITDSEILRYYSYYHVDTGALVGEFNGYAAKPPLAFNASLMASALQQSTYQAGAGVQTHNSADGTTFDKRISATGYNWSGLGENVYAYAEDVFFGHVGLMADWGVPSLDHRDNLLNIDASVPTFREIGISCVDSSINNFGPTVITQDFGTPATAGVAYVTGVVYQDGNGNGAYDDGEGLGGVTITPSAGTYYAVTSASGGFVIPLPTSGSGTLTITASGGGLGAARTKTVNYTAGTNVKVDFTPADAAGTGPQSVTMTAPAQNAVSSAQPGQVVVSRAGNTSQPLKVRLLYSGTAVSGVDYAPLPPKVTIPAGAASATLAVLPTAPAKSAPVTLIVKVKPKATYVLPNPAQAVTSVQIYPQP